VSAADDDATRHALALRQRAVLVERLGWTVDVLERRGRRYTDVASEVVSLLPDLSRRPAAPTSLRARTVVIAVASFGVGLGVLALRERFARNRAWADLGRALSRLAAPSSRSSITWRIAKSVGPLVLMLARAAVRVAAERRITVRRQAPRDDAGVIAPP
jgi:hypothetical protein